MTLVIDFCRILRWAATSAFADLRAIYTWKTWTFAWLVRILCQVAFYALIGRFLGSTAATTFLLEGNGVFVGVATVLFIVPSTAWERAAEAFPLQVASPSHPFVVFAGRSAQWLLDALGVSTASLVLVSLLFGLKLNGFAVLAVLPMLLIIFMSTYWFGLTIAAVILGRPQLRNIVGNISGLVLMIVAGVQVPTAYWPIPIQWLAQGLPLTHGLLAIRAVLAGSGIAWNDLALECCVGLGWFLISMLTFRWLSERGRRDGSIEFDE